MKLSLLEQIYKCELKKSEIEQAIIMSLLFRTAKDSKTRTVKKTQCKKSKITI